MRIVFFGTPELAVPTLEALGADADLRPLAVFTQPPARRSRRGEPESSPVGTAARELGVELHEVASVNEGPALARLTQLAPDVIVVVAFGQMLKKAVLKLPVHGCVNFHPSMLPAYRGAAPVQRAVMDGVVDSGLTIMRLVKKMDAGPILLQRPWRLSPDKNAEELLAEAGQLGAPLMLQALRSIATLMAQDQEEARATYAPPLVKEDGLLQFDQGAVALHNRVRAVQPWPRASCTTGGKRVIVHRTSLAEESGAPGRVLRVDRQGIIVACGTGALRLEEVQLEGKPKVHARDAANGLRLQPGTVFET
ncbi:MAG: methionyl-tRNA formyltransferase [Planctomycetes bacterium]|nr:methionyl-tRNA formyltransferase [Planctomycetota bacterium]